MASIPGTHKRSLQGYNTFIPHPLPPKLSLTVELERHIEEAVHLLGQVEMCRRLLPNAELLIYGSLQREAIASSTIEDTIASPDELVLFQVSQQTEREAVREVANYATALEWGYEQLKTRPIAYNLIIGLHQRLLMGVRGQEAAGRLKTDQNYIGSRRTDPIERAVFVPPPPEATMQLISDLEKYINNPANREPRLVQCALAHYQFETVHPFGDGNGRVGRLLIMLQLIQLELLSAPLIYPSVYFERNRQTYYARLQAVREEGAWNEWLAFFTDGVKSQCHETINLTKTVLDLREHLRQEIGNVRRRSALNAVLDAFFEEPALSVGEICRRANMSWNSAQAALEILQEKKIVAELTGRPRGRVYACRPVLKAIFGTDLKLETAATVERRQEEERRNGRVDTRENK
jgi:Fic family protein